MTEPETMIERVAEALAVMAWPSCDSERCCCDRKEAWQCVLRCTAEEFARAALEALRKPTPAMIAAGETFVEYSAEACWERMVDAALGGKGEG